MKYTFQDSISSFIGYILYLLLHLYEYLLSTIAFLGPPTPVVHRLSGHHSNMYSVYCIFLSHAISIYLKFVPALYQPIN